MNMRLVRRVIAGLILSGFVFALSGCIGGGVWDPTEAKNLEAKLSIGDTRQKVRAVLGEPLLDARSLGLEVYRKTGRDLEYFWVIWPIPVPSPGDKVIGYVLVDYDEQDVVSEFAADYWVPIYGRGKHADLWITAGGHHFLNTETLLAPAIPWEKLAEATPSDNACTLVLVMGECLMGQVSLNNLEIADLSPGVCAGYWNNNLYGTFIRKEISPGTHRLDIHYKQGRGDFETVFSCESGETVYAELEADTVDDKRHMYRFEGVISISKSLTENIIKMGDLSAILWHRGTWYGPLTSPTAGSK
jgi:hypothetical protein